MPVPPAPSLRRTEDLPAGNGRPRRLLGQLLTLSLALCTPAAVRGDAGTPGTNAAVALVEEANEAFPTQVEEITVTARRHSQDAQEVPGALSVLTGDDLELLRIDDVGDLDRDVPNAVIEKSAGSATSAKIFLRGIGTDDFLFTFEPAVGIYVDDVYIPRQNGALYGLFDLERVELVRGPQGTLYGRNTSGGALKLYTHQPGGRRSRHVMLTAGGDAQLDLGATFGGRLGGSLYGKVSLLARQRDGYSTDLVSGRRVNDQDTAGARVSLRHLGGGDRLDVVLGLDVERDRSGPGFASSVLVDPDSDPYTLESGLDARNDLDQRGASLKVQISPQTLPISVQSITAVRELEHLTFFDGDGLPTPNLHLFQDQDQRQLSQEVQIASTRGGSWQWVLGAFLLEEENEQPTRQDIFGPGNTYRIAQDTSSRALFGQLSYLASRWRFTGGLRWSDESKEFTVAASAPDGRPLFDLDARDSWSHVDYRAEVVRAFGDGVRVYSSVASGFKSGGFNGRGATPSTFNAYAEEEVVTWEAGLKSDLLGRRLRLNANLFLSDYRDLQLSVLGPDGFFRVLNAADVRIEGLELELEAVPRSRLELSAALGLLEGRYEALDDPRFDPAGLHLKQAPEVTFRAAALYTFLLGERAYLSASADLSHTGRHFQNVANTPEIATRAYTLLGARVALGPQQGRWELTLRGSNLGDATYVTGGFAVAPLGVASVYLNRPRWWEASLRIRF